jgi:hypothetical protein
MASWANISDERRLHALALLAWSDSIGRDTKRDNMSRNHKKGRSEMAGITRAEFERKQLHNQAGYGTPLKPDAEGVWWTQWEDGYGTTLVTNGKIVEKA